MAEKLEKSIVKTRPYWHVDAKWFFGILAGLFLAQSLFVFCLYQLTKKEIAVPIMATVTASMFSPNGLDETGDIEKIKSDIKNTPGDTFKPIPTMNLTINKKDIEGKSPKEIRIMIFTKFVEPVYTGELPPEILGSPEAIEEFRKDTTLLRGFSANTHNGLKTVSTVFILITIFFLSLSIFFSYRLGRIVTPAIILIFTSFFPALIFTAFRLVTSGIGTREPAMAEQLGRGREGLIVVLPQVTGIFSKTYGYTFIFGIGLLFLALLMTGFFRRKNG